jgi:D-beta-D-heptose 7-phosphate kinase/D-beta-D-heptose 1-phosphate adenosyltransferase
MKTPSPEDKIFGTDQWPILKKVCRQATDLGRKLVFTNGCFDILHRGHVSYLQASAGLGDMLIVGLNTDRSVAALKGPQRPLNKTADRAYVLAALQCVDAVVVFDEDTPLQLISFLSPDVLVKGGDYSPDRVVGAEHVQGLGGRVEIIPFVTGYSTTSLIKKMHG